MFLLTIYKSLTSSYGWIIDEFGVRREAMNDKLSLTKMTHKHTMSA